MGRIPTVLNFDFRASNLILTVKPIFLLCLILVRHLLLHALNSTQWGLDMLEQYLKIYSLLFLHCTTQDALAQGTTAL